MVVSREPKKTDTYQSSSGYPSSVMYNYIMEARDGQAKAQVELELMTADRDKWKELYEQAVRNGQ